MSLSLAYYRLPLSLSFHCPALGVSRLGSSSDGFYVWAPSANGLQFLIDEKLLGLP